MVEIPKRGGWGVRHLGKTPKKSRIFFLTGSLSTIDQVCGLKMGASFKKLGAMLQKIERDMGNFGC